MQEFRQGGVSSELDDTAEGFCAFGLDVLRCPRCAGRMPLMATIDDLAVIQRIHGRDWEMRAVFMENPVHGRPASPVVGRRDQRQTIACSVLVSKKWALPMSKTRSMS